MWGRGSRDVAAGSLTDRRSEALSPVDGPHAPGNQLTGPRVRAVAAAPPADDLLRQIWERLSRKPRTARRCTGTSRGRGTVFTRGQELERGDWGAAAAAEPVTTTAMAVALSSVATATAVTHGR